MKISNFKYVKTTKNKDKYLQDTIFDVIHATIDITTGMLKWKETKIVTVFKEYGFWVYSDGSGFTPGFVVEDLADEYLARNNGVWK